MALNYADMASGYTNLWASMKITRGAECDRAARIILAAKSRYQAIERQTGVPWFWIGIVHMRESNNNFAGVLHNGEHIIGTGRRTRLVPAGRGPFSTWEEAAVDAIKMHGLHKITEWPVSRIGYECERFNGWGYVPRGINSPYVWSGSSHYRGGKYVADGVFSYGTMDSQLGCMPVLASLCKMDEEVNKRVNGKPGVSRKTVPIAAGGGAVVAVGVNHGWGWGEWCLVALLILLVVGVVYAIWNYVKPKAQPLPPVVDDPTADKPQSGKAIEPGV